MDPISQAASWVQAFRTWIIGLEGWRRSLGALAAGGLSVVGFAPFFASPILFLTLPIFVWLIDASRGAKQAAWIGWSFGFGYYFFSLFWIGEAFLVEAEKFAALLPLAVTLLPAGLALFYAGAAFVARRFWFSGFSRILMLASTIAIAEWLRGHVLTGFPWNVLGYALTGTDILMQSAALVGVYALTIPAVVIFASPLVLLADGWRPLRAIAAAVVPIAAMAAYGALRLPAGSVEMVPGVKLRLVQPSVPQREKWLPEFQGRIFEDHLALSRTGADGTQDKLESITHVIWPEAAMPFLPLEHPDALAAIADMLPPGRMLITGALRRATDADKNLPPGDRRRQGYNSMLVFRDDGVLAATYDKIHLVPFGEYLPLERVFGALGLARLAHGHGSFLTGIEPRPLLSIAGMPPAAALICYEALFPGAVVQGVERPGLLLNLTNDGWFGSTIGPPGHFHQAKVRAVEEGLPLVRVANNGISGVIDPYGRVIQTLGLNIRKSVDSPLPVSLSSTPYSRVVDFNFLILLLICLGTAFGMERRPRTRILP
jgi:apolipoprotein N-acyltransferase